MYGEEGGRGERKKKWERGRESPVVIQQYIPVVWCTNKHNSLHENPHAFCLVSVCTYRYLHSTHKCSNLHGLRHGLRHVLDLEQIMMYGQVYIRYIGCTGLSVILFVEAQEHYLVL